LLRLGLTPDGPPCPPVRAPAALQAPWLARLVHRACGRQGPPVALALPMAPWVAPRRPACLALLAALPPSRACHLGASTPPRSRAWCSPHRRCRCGAGRTAVGHLTQPQAGSVARGGTLRPSSSLLHCTAPRHAPQVFETRVNGVHAHPPSSSTRFIVRDRGDASPRLLRSTLNVVPLSADMLSNSGMQFALSVQPLALADPEDDAVAVSGWVCVCVFWGGGRRESAWRAAQRQHARAASWLRTQPH
jgi:protein transport protein SEC24